MSTPTSASITTPTARDWAVVLLLLAAATGMGFLLEGHISLTSQAMFYVLAVVIVAYSLPKVPSLVSAFGAVTAFNFFFVPPRWTFEVESREHLISLFAMLTVALVSVGKSRRTFASPPPPCPSRDPPPRPT